MAQTSSKKTYTVNRDNLPLHCPFPKMDQELWSAHPQVYLPIEKTGEAVCPYCGTHFILQNGEG